jgi:hypothetical protein
VARAARPWSSYESYCSNTMTDLNPMRIPANSDRRSGVFGHPAVRSEVAKRPTFV